MLSVYGCYQHNRSSTTSNVGTARLDAEQGPYMPLLHQDTTNRSRIDHLANPHAEMQNNHITPVWSYIFQILFQVWTINHQVYRESDRHASCQMKIKLNLYFFPFVMFLFMLLRLCLSLTFLFLFILTSIFFFTFNFVFCSLLQMHDYTIDSI